MPKTSQSQAEKERVSRPLTIVSQSDDESSDQSPDERPLAHLLNEQYSVEPAQQGAAAHIASLPVELLIRVLSHVDVYTVEAASAVCRRWYSVARDNTLWRMVRLLPMAKRCSHG